MTRSNVTNSLLQNGSPILTAVYVGLGFGPCTSRLVFCSNLFFTSSQGCEDQFVAGVFFKGETFLYQNPVPHRNEPTQTVHGVSGAIWRGMLNHFQGDGSEWFFVVHIRTHCAVLARSKQLILMPVTVKFRLDFFVCGLQGHLSWHLAKSAPCFHVTKATKAMNNCRDSASGQGWRRGCQPFSCRCSLNVMHCRKEIYGTCSSKESMPFVKSKPSLPTVPEAWGPWELQHPPPSHYGCIMLAKNRVVVFKIWTTGYWLWSWLFCICDCWKSMKNCRDSSLCLRGLEARLPAFKLPMFAKCDALPKQIKESIPAILFGNFKHYACVMPIPLLQLQKKDLSMQRSRGFGQGVVVSKICYVQHSDCDLSCAIETAAKQRALVEIELLATASWSCKWSLNVRRVCLRPTRSLRLHHAHPFLAAAEKKLSRSCGLQDLLRTIQWLCPRFGLQGIDCALSCDMWLLQTNEPLSRLSF